MPTKICDKLSLSYLAEICFRQVQTLSSYSSESDWNCFPGPCNNKKANKDH